MKDVLMVGPKRTTKGGISSVINLYMSSSLNKKNNHKNANIKEY